VALLTRDIVKSQILVIMGSESDHEVADRVLDTLKDRGFNGDTALVISCHRNLEKLREFARKFQGQVVICVGGKSFQLPAILDSLFRELGKHVVVFGIPVGKTYKDRRPAVSAMRDLPKPCKVHAFTNNFKTTIQKAVDEAADYVQSGAVPPGESETEWQDRFAAHRRSSAIIYRRRKEG
jgi:phosphoribosylcarboxyaminoimidazole (NCAIR) mutase